MMIKMLVMDVDGTLTDGKIYIGSSGELMKAFDVKDGYAIVQLTKQGVIPVIITGRESEILKKRATELKIKELHQGVENKLECLKQIATKHVISAEEIAYIGDDINDLEAKMKELFENKELADKFGKSAKEFALNEYSPNGYYEKIEKIYKNVLGEN